MHRKELSSPQTSGRGKSLIAIRTTQQHQRKLQGAKSQLPRSYSTPAQEKCKDNENKGYILRSFSSPEPKLSKQNPEVSTKYKSQGSRSELDSDSEQFEQFDDCLLDIDADTEDVDFKSYYLGPDVDKPKRILTTLLPGAGLQKISIRPVATSISQIKPFQDTVKKMKSDREETKNKGLGGIKFEPLVLKLPGHQVPRSASESPDIEELHISPQLEFETLELEREFADAEQQLNRGAAIAMQESDIDMVKITIIEILVQPTLKKFKE